MTEMLVDPRLQALADRYDETLVDPSDIFLHPEDIGPQTWAELPKPESGYRDAKDLVLGLATAWLIWREIFIANVIGTTVTKPALDITREATEQGLRRFGERYRRYWNYLVQPIFSHAMTLGSTGVLSTAEHEHFAQLYANQVFDYVNKSSAEAVIGAYKSQLADRWDPHLAWQRATSGYGLDTRSMRQYVQLAVTGDVRTGANDAAKLFVEKALSARAFRIAEHEVYSAQELGKTVFWLHQMNNGQLPKGTKRRWVTAEDEKVCPICAPMDQREEVLDERFLLPDGQKVWAPVVHPACRCTVRLVGPQVTMVERVRKHLRGTLQKRWVETEHPRSTDGEFTTKPDTETAPAVADMDLGQGAFIPTFNMAQMDLAPLEQIALTPPQQVIQQVSAPAPVAAPAQPQVVGVARMDLGAPLLAAPVVAPVAAPVAAEPQVQADEAQATVTAPPKLEMIHDHYLPTKYWEKTQLTGPERDVMPGQYSYNPGQVIDFDLVQPNGQPVQFFADAYASPGEEPNPSQELLGELTNLRDEEGGPRVPIGIDKRNIETYNDTRRALFSEATDEHAMRDALGALWDRGAAWRNMLRDGGMKGNAYQDQPKDEAINDVMDRIQGHNRYTEANTALERSYMDRVQMEPDLLNITIPNDAAEDFKAARMEMMEDHDDLEFIRPSVFVFTPDLGYTGTMSDHYDLMQPSGKYEVDHIEVEPVTESNLDYLSGVGPDIDAVKFVYLKPFDPSKEDEPAIPIQEAKLRPDQIDF